MKQLLSLFLFLLPCLAWAQYPSNGNQKITLGEQTSADGLIWRGVLADTGIITPLSDTSAYIILDTANHRFYNYNRATNVWSVAGGGGSVTSVAAITLGTTGTDLSSTVANSTTTPVITLNVPNASATARGVVSTSTQTFAGSKTFTNLTSQNFAINIASASRGGFYPYNLIVGGGSTDYSVGLYSEGEIYMASGGTATKRFTLKTTGQSVFTDLLVKGTSNYGYLNIDNSVTNFGGGAVSVLQNGVNCGGFGVQGAIFGTSDKNVLFYSDVAKDMIFATIPTSTIITRMTIASSGNITIANLAGTGSRAVLADVNGVLSAPVSSINTKENVQTLNYGLNELLQINPVSFDYINKDKWGDGRNLGFIVEDMFSVIPEVTGTMNNGDMYLDMTKLIPILTKAIQEQQALIKALEQRIINLENK